MLYTLSTNVPIAIAKAKAKKRTAIKRVEKSVFLSKSNIYLSLACKSTAFLYFENELTTLNSSTKLLILSQELNTTKFVFLKMLSIVLLGTGNVAHHLFDTLIQLEDVQVKQVYGRSPEKLAYFTNKSATTSYPDDITEADIYIIAVNDNAVAEVSSLISTKKGLIVHTSGSIAKNVLKAKRKGVFYPLQTFTNGKTVDFTAIPICIEADEEADLKTLKTLAKKITESVYEISSAQREKLHLAAVFVNNFTNHMYALGHEVCEKEKLPFDLLVPLIKETADKLRFLTPDKAQTGPAKRNDVVTMQKHIDALESPLNKKIYQLISESIRGSKQ